MSPEGGAGTEAAADGPEAAADGPEAAADGPVAVVGLGRMGGPIADRVLAAGFRTAVFDVDPAAVGRRVEAGARAATSPADAGAGASVGVIVVFDDAQALEVVDGPEGLLRALPSDAVVCVHTTVSRRTAEELARRGEERGVPVLDAGISGGESGAGSGTLLTMVGGPAEALERARPVLDAYSKEVVHAGGTGAGMALKLARNATSFAVMAAVHEALLMAHRSDVDLTTLRHVLANTGLFEQGLVPAGLGPPVPAAEAFPELEDTFRHTVRMAEKDLDLALSLGYDLGIDLEVFATVRRMFHAVMRV